MVETYFSNDSTDDLTLSLTSQKVYEETKGDTMFECCICLETSKDPVVTTCGHLFCWACIY